MGLFSRRKIDNTAAGVLPRPVIQPGPTTIHNHGISWATIIVVSFFCALALLPVGWWILVFLFDRMGYINPERQAAWLLVALPFGLGSLWLVSLFIGSILDRFFEYKRDIAALVLETEKAKLLTAQSSAVDHIRASEDDIKFARLIIAVMYNAITYGPRGLRGEIRWSRRMAIAINNQHNLGLSQAKCSEVATWLLEHGIITKKDEISPKYDNLGEVARLVSDAFNVPVKVVSDLGMSGQHLRGQSGDSWG